MKLMRAWTLGAACCAAACSPPPLQARGGPCVSLSDCAVGLVCEDGRCTGDLSGLAAENDPPPFLELVDAGRDAGPDAGSPGPADAAPMDTGPGKPPDSGGPVVDSGPGPVDAGRPMDAAAPPPKDGG